MSGIYLVKSSAVSEGKTLSAPDSTYSIDFDADERGEFAVLSFRVPVADLKRLAASRTRFLEVSSTEVRSLLTGIIGNPQESQSIRQKATEILGEKSCL
jgi:hypothetical protein